MINKKYNDINFVISNLDLISRIDFKYKDYSGTIFTKVAKSYYVEIDRIGYEMESESFNDPIKLFENVIIDGCKLKDIWNKVKITDIQKNEI